MMSSSSSGGDPPRAPRPYLAGVAVAFDQAHSSPRTQRHCRVRNVLTTGGAGGGTAGPRHTAAAAGGGRVWPRYRGARGQWRVPPRPAPARRGTDRVACVSGGDVRGRSRLSDEREQAQFAAHVALGRPAVTPAWLEACADTANHVPEAPYTVAPPPTPAAGAAAAAATAEADTELQSPGAALRAVRLWVPRAFVAEHPRAHVDDAVAQLQRLGVTILSDAAERDAPAGGACTHVACSAQTGAAYTWVGRGSVHVCVCVSGCRGTSLTTACI
jgi:hypothetical protein